jgi:hypothetical protein
MSEINRFNNFILCKIMWHDVVMIYQLLDDVTVNNWWMMWTPYMTRELYYMTYNGSSLYKYRG